MSDPFVSFGTQKAHTRKTPAPGVGQTSAKQVGGTKPRFGATLGNGLAAPFKAMGRAISDLNHNARFRAGNEAFTAKTQHKINEFLQLRESGTATKQEIQDARKEVMTRLRVELDRSELYSAAKSSSETLDCGGVKATMSSLLDNSLNALTASSPDRLASFLKSGLSVEQGISIIAYSEAAYVGVNAQLRSGNTTPLVDLYIKTVNEGLEALPKFDQTLGDSSPSSYRIASLPTNVDAQYQVGNIVSDPGFLSTTYNPDFTFAGGLTQATHCINIQLGDNSKGRAIDWLSSLPHEKEILFPPGTEFRVALRDRDDMPTSKSGSDVKDMVGIVLVEVGTKADKQATYEVRSAMSFLSDEDRASLPSGKTS